MYSSNYNATQRSPGRPVTPSTPTSAKSILTFAESLRTFRTPSPTNDSPTDEEAEQIWEAARIAPPLFPALSLIPLNAEDVEGLHDVDHDYELPANLQLGPDQSAFITDNQDAAGNRLSILLVYETEDAGVQATSVGQQNGTGLQEDCVLDYSHLHSIRARGFQGNGFIVVDPSMSRQSQASTSAAPVAASTKSGVHGQSSTIQSTNKGKGKGKEKEKEKEKEKGKVYKLKQASKLHTPPKAKTHKLNSEAAGKTTLPVQERRGLSQVRPVQVQTAGSSQAGPAQPVPRKTVGNPNRMTRWADFSRYTAEEQASVPPIIHPSTHASPRRKPSPDLNKPLPRIPSPGSHLRLTQYFEPTSNEQSFNQPRTASSERKSVNRRTAIYAGSVFSSPDMSQEEDLYDSSRPESPVVAQTPPTSGDEGDDGSIERHQLLDRLNQLGHCDDDEQISMHLDAPYKSRRFNEPVNHEIGRLDCGLGRPFDPEDEDYKSPVVDTFVHEGHTSFVITERLDENTIRSMYGTQERQVRDTAEVDPTKAVWANLTSQVGGGGWSAD